MKTKNTLLIIAISSILAACGSSSNQGTTPPTNTTTTPPSGTTTPTTDGTTNNQTGGTTTPTNNQTTLTGYTGSRLETILNANIPSSHSRFQASSNVNKLLVNGKYIDLIPTGKASYGFFDVTRIPSGVNGDGLPRIISGTKYTSRFGLIGNGNTGIAFSQGNATANMPVSGTANYVGDYVGYNHITNMVGRGTVKAIVNFSDKSITMTATNDDVGNLGGFFEGKFQGNTFEVEGGYPGGVYKNIKGTGQFYGDNAAEMSGTYSNYNDYSAAFGAKKQ